MTDLGLRIPTGRRADRPPRSARRVLLAVLAVFLLGALLRTFFFTTAVVSSDSMAPTLCPGNLAVLQHLQQPRPAVGDIVTFSDPQTGDPTIKRVVAVGGQQVGIADAQLVVDGQVVSERYVDLDTIDGVYFGPVTVPAGRVFLMGDNREFSIDSRVFGSLPTSEIDGRLLFTLGPSCS